MYYRTLLMLMLFVALTSSCPFPCICRWKNGKQTAECANKDLLVIPASLESDTQVLEFSGNNLRTLHREKFLKLHLMNLQRIYLSRCRISVVNGQTFKGLTNLVELDLSENLLESVPSDSFQDCPSLMRLSLSRNPIKELNENAFKHLSLLSMLELSNCDISKVHTHTFDGLYSLEWLNLESNKMKSFPALLPASLKGIQLQGNPWKCDCNLLDFQEFLVKFAYPFSHEPVCKTPSSLVGRKIKSVPKDELACLPDVSPTTFYLEIDEGKNISLVCQVHAIPEAMINWYFEGQLLRNDTYISPELHLLYYVEQGLHDKRSELFIFNANSGDTGTFICNAENSAGVSNANFTIRVLLKQSTRQEVDELPMELVFIAILVTVSSVLLLLAITAVCVLKCRRNSRLRRKRDDSKVAFGNSTADTISRESSDTITQNKGSNFKLVNYDEFKIAHIHSDENVIAVTHNQAQKCYQEQNPDIINGTEIIENSDYGVILQRQHSVMRNVEYDYMSDQGVSDCNLYFMHDVVLNPIVNCYRTLPNKRRAANASFGRLSRDAEFLNRNPTNAASTASPLTYEYFECDIRYTADGYPVKALDKCQQAVPNPESHKSFREALESGKEEIEGTLPIGPSCGQETHPSNVFHT
ncbi:leucine-rich repeat-containing protein 24-like [Diorhabda carinulata]|uniref:leucine-rich repeat-containing protein 24-like n=1 Tax=Diorhabda carinulata TaxID=1163345 RepID=UPI0025A00FFA|nr:leucine-rich repeat-containing protein 24-like [Diorhabda carinulata]XP_057671037.1 leucine-rich repeat-containing protein 24-like [Diorhabda carinulata]